MQKVENYNNRHAETSFQLQIAKAFFSHPRHARYSFFIIKTATLTECLKIRLIGMNNAWKCSVAHSWRVVFQVWSRG